MSKRPQTNSFFQILHKFLSLASTASSANTGLRFKSIAIFVCLVFFSAPPPGRWREGRRKWWALPSDSTVWIFGRGSVDKQQVGSFFPPTQMSHFYSGRRGRREEGDFWHMAALLFVSCASLCCRLLSSLRTWCARWVCALLLPQIFFQAGGWVCFVKAIVFISASLFSRGAQMTYSMEIRTGENSSSLPPLKQATSLNCHSLPRPAIITLWHVWAQHLSRAPTQRKRKT